MVKNEENYYNVCDDKEGTEVRECEKESLIFQDKELENMEPLPEDDDVMLTAAESGEDKSKSSASCSASMKKFNGKSKNHEDEKTIIRNDTHKPVIESDRSNVGKMQNEPLEEEEDDQYDELSQRKKNLKKAGVAVAGGALITAGIPLIPVLCTGELMIIGGMALLATEFDSAKNVLIKGRENLAKFAENDEETIDSKKANETLSQKSEMTTEGSNVCNNSKADSKVEEKARKIAKNMRHKLKKMVKKDLLPMIDRFTEKGEKEQK